ncbi:hypothetical protein CkaCkLH20_09683 [Colletotrichum karsti]|uniref:Uncharacterized protein n=1 Tax=Colletotrichum karsti TaxID=1095194 RepID=A0A9P6LHP8_9PEZI|nr:uncharacterized protein CkaCkLH20_09683 [Colletotrichum karsti]KAF9872820.1 hypothetical protein CkaCkLH20_09683 [Colletotrichum karsti]
MIKPSFQKAGPASQQAAPKKDQEMGLSRWDVSPTAPRSQITYPIDTEMQNLGLPRIGFTSPACFDRNAAGYIRRIPSDSRTKAVQTPADQFKESLSERDSGDPYLSPSDTDPSASDSDSPIDNSWEPGFRKGRDEGWERPPTSVPAPAPEPAPAGAPRSISQSFWSAYEYATDLVAGFGRPASQDSPVRSEPASETSASPREVTHQEGPEPAVARELDYDTDGDSDEVMADDDAGADEDAE